MSREIETDFLRRLKHHADWFKSHPVDEVILIHHNDADGLSAGAILQSAFYRDNRRVRRLSLEKPYPEALERIIESIDVPSRALMVLADFASGMIPHIEQLLPPGLTVLILDHHQLSPKTTEAVRVVNPVALGISGRSHATASTVSYLFAKALNPWNSDLALNALIGIMGDGQFQAPLLVEGLNVIPLDDALQNRSIEMFPVPAASGYPLERIVAAVNALGSIGYFEGGTDIAVKGLVDGWGLEVDTVAQQYLDRFCRLTEKFISEVSLNREGRLCWFVLGSEFEPFGVKTVGLLCEELIRRGKVQDDCYVLGIQPVPAHIPGVGTLAIAQEKVSMRVTPKLLVEVEKGAALSLTEVLPIVVSALGGFVDACHPHAAAVTISPADRQRLISGVRDRIS